MSEPQPIPQGQQPVVGAISAPQLNQLRNREQTYNQLEADIAELAAKHAQATRLRLLISNELKQYANALIAEHVDTVEGANYRVDPDTGQIFMVSVAVPDDAEATETPDEDPVVAEAVAAADEAERAAAAALGRPDATLSELAAARQAQMEAERPTPHQYKANRAPMNSDAQRCLECGLNFDEIPGVHIDDEQPQPAE